MRRNRATIRPTIPDPRHQSRVVSKFMSNLMRDGPRPPRCDRRRRRRRSRRRSSSRRAIDVFEQALRNVTPIIEVKPRRVGGATYQVPVDIRTERRQALALRWILDSSRRRGGRSMPEKLAGELLDAANNSGNAIRRKEETHRMAEANRAFVHYRW